MNGIKKKDNEDIYQDPQEELRKKGIYYITGEIDTDSLLDIHQDILLKHTDPNWKDDIQLVINTVGGSCAEGWALVDLIKWVKMGARTIGMGECCSLGAMLLAAGDKNKRIAAKNCCVMIHGASWCIDGNKPQIVAKTKWYTDEENREVAFWTEHSNLTTSREIKTKLLKGTDIYLTAEESLELGIVDEIQGLPKKPIKKVTRKRSNKRTK